MMSVLPKKLGIELYTFLVVIGYLHTKEHPESNKSGHANKRISNVFLYPAWFLYKIVNLEDEIKAIKDKKTRFQAKFLTQSRLKEIILETNQGQILTFLKRFDAGRGLGEVGNSELRFHERYSQIEKIANLSETFDKQEQDDLMEYFRYIYIQILKPGDKRGFKRNEKAELRELFFAGKLETLVNCYLNFKKEDPKEIGIDNIERDALSYIRYISRPFMLMQSRGFSYLKILGIAKEKISKKKSFIKMMKQ